MRSKLGNYLTRVLAASGLLMLAGRLPLLAQEAVVDGAEQMTSGSLLQGIDWIVLGIFFVAVIAIGLAAARTAGKDTSEFFLGGRGMPWWLLGVSMVACTFSCDTPNLVTDLVRGGGVGANWAWWAFLITGMVTVFIYAQLWRRSNVMTDLEFYEMRYSGKPAAVLRGFRSLYLGIFFNCLIMGSVTLAAIKIGQIIFDIDPLPAVIFASIGVVLYATAGGIKGCIWADFFQYSIAMFGAVYAAIVAVRQPEVGGLTAMLSNPLVADKLSWMPDFSTWLAWVPMLLIPVAVQWWAVWYPGAEPGGGGYIAQRMLAAKDEKNAIGATLFFNFMHYAMRPWPWIIVALASLICYPTLESINATFPNIDPVYLKQDIAYPAMIARLGPGFLGLVVASLIAAYMSTIGTHLNWGSSYAVNDFYKRFIRKDANEKELVLVARVCTVLLMVIAAFFALTFLRNAGQAFQILLLSGAGTGAIYLMRWFWWRINAWTEIMAMVAATVVAFWIVLGVGNEGTVKWYVDNSSIADRVYAIEDAELADSITAQIAEAAPTIAALEETAQGLTDELRAAKKKSKAEYAAAVAAYKAKKSELDALKGSVSIAGLVSANKTADWVAGLTAFKAEHESTDGVIKGSTVYVYDTMVNGLAFPVQLMICVIVVTLTWIITTLVTPPVEAKTLRNFYKICHPGGPGWRKVVAAAKADGENIDERNLVTDWKLPIQILCVFLGCVAIYCSLFAVGNFVYGKIVGGVIMTVCAIIATVVLFVSFGKLGTESSSS